MPGDALENIKNLKCDIKTLIEDHISKFKALLTQSGMKKSLLVINYFRQTLLINLQRKIMLLENTPVMLDDWYKWTKQVDKTYKKMQRMLGQVPAKTETKEEPKKRWNLAKKDPNTMDIDSMSTEQRAEAMKKGLCFRCGKQGHLNRDCPDKKGKKPAKKKEEKKK